MVYHFWARMAVQKMATNQLRKSGIYYRWANEIPLVFLIVILVMVVVKPI
jgi:putative membrane protein